MIDIKDVNARRKELGLSVEELAEKANLPKSTVEKILFGIVKHPRVDTMQALETALNLEDVPPKEKTAESPKKEAPQVDLELWRRTKRERKMTFGELSELSKIPQRTIEDIFAGRTPRPRIDTVKAIETALGVAPVQIETYTYGLTDDEKILIDYYRRLVPANKLTVFNLLRSVFDSAQDIPIETVRQYIGMMN